MKDAPFLKVMTFCRCPALVSITCAADFFYPAFNTYPTQNVRGESLRSGRPTQKQCGLGLPLALSGEACLKDVGCLCVEELGGFDDEQGLLSNIKAQ